MASQASNLLQDQNIDALGPHGTLGFVNTGKIAIHIVPSVPHKYPCLTTKDNIF